MAKSKITEQEMAFILERMDGFEDGASLRDAVWSIWVKTGTKWVYHDLSGSYKILSAEELLRTYGFAGFRTNGAGSGKQAIPCTEEMTAEDIILLSEEAFQEIDMGATVIAQDDTFWVYCGNRKWVHETAEGGFIFLEKDDLIALYGPLVPWSKGKVQIGIRAY